MINNSDNLLNRKEENFNLKKEISYYLFFLPWFLLTIIMALLGSYTYLRYTPKIYSSSAQIQIKKSDASSSFLTTEVTTLFQGTRVNVQNDIAVITSNHILTKVVQLLNLQTSITEVGRVKSSLLYKTNIPFKINFKDSDKFQNWTFSISQNSGVITNGIISFKLDKNKSIDNDYLSLTINDSESLNQNKVYNINRTSLKYSTSLLKKRISATASSKNGEVIDLSISGTNRMRNDAILNTLLEVITEDRIIDERQVSKASIDFIDNRLSIIKNTIKTITQETIDYQLKNNVYNTEKQTTNTLSNIIKETEAVFNLQIQLEIATSLLEQLKKQSKFEILPANIGINDVSVNQLLESYNTLVIDRNNLLVSADKKSPLVLQINKQLNKLRKANIEGVEVYINNINISLMGYKKTNDINKGIIAGFPQKEYKMRSLAREFKFAEDLLVFLSQRKEEASISYASVLPNLKVLSYGVTNNSPIAPKKNIIYFGGIGMGFFLPFIILYLLKILDTKINTREDLEKGLPGLSILGEVPFDENYSNKDDRSITAESTRVIRSSMSFLLNQNKPQVIIATSTIKGEGKSFVSYNIAQSYNALGKKVILIGADLRNPQVHTLLGIERGNLGLSTFLNDVNYNDLDKLIVKGKSIDEIDYLLSGAIPPNPSELLMRPRMKELLEILKSSYDLIIIDSAPLLLVSDTTPILPLCDLVVYVSRAQYSDKNLFPFIKEIHGRENMPPFGMVLNGLIASPSSSSYGYGYRYSYRYRYSYTYKYNYGYGYGYGRDED